MRSFHSTFATLMLLIPVGSIPALAIFGIPQFAPVVASPIHEGPSRDREQRVGNSARHPSEELFSELDDFSTKQDEPSSRMDASGNSRFPTGQMGDSVSITERKSGQRSRPENQQPFTQVAEVPGSAPSWADDSSSNNSRPNTPFKGTQIDQVSDSSIAFESGGMDDRMRQGLQSGGLQNNAMPNGQFAPPSYRRSSNSSSRGGTKRASNSEQLFADGDRTGDSFAQDTQLQGFQRQRNSSGQRNSPASTEPENVMTWPDAVRRLNELEIRNFRLEPGRQPGQFVFICSYTPSESPRVSYRFESEADEPLKAVDKVLAQIDEWRQRKQ